MGKEWVESVRRDTWATSKQVTAAKLETDSEPVEEQQRYLKSPTMNR